MMNKFDLIFYNINIMSRFKQTIHDIIAMRDRGFEKNLNIRRGIDFSSTVVLNNGVSIIKKPSEYYIDIDYILFKTQNGFIKIKIFVDYINIYMYDSNGNYIHRNIEYYTYSNDLIEIHKIMERYL